MPSRVEPLLCSHQPQDYQLPGTHTWCPLHHLLSFPSPPDVTSPSYFKSTGALLQLTSLQRGHRPILLPREERAILSSLTHFFHQNLILPISGILSKPHTHLSGLDGITHLLFTCYGADIPKDGLNRNQDKRQMF